jgi:hypothetical protein
LLARSRNFYGQSPLAVDSPCYDFGSILFGNGTRLAGKERFIDARGPVRHDTVCRNLLARADKDVVAFG